MRYSRRASDAPHARLRGVVEDEVDWPDAANGDDGGFGEAFYDAIVVGGFSDTVDEAADGYGDAGGWVEVGPAVAPPCA
jgi:hypothetical protein